MTVTRLKLKPTCWTVEDPLGELGYSDTVVPTNGSYVLICW